MALDHLGEAARNDLPDIVGYLNFSAGAPDSQFLGGLSRLFADLDTEVSHPPLWKRVGAAILDAIDELQGSSEAFENLDQARDVAQLAFAHALPAYRQHHGDLLMHQTEEGLFQPFFVVCADIQHDRQRRVKVVSIFVVAQSLSKGALGDEKKWKPFV